MYGAAVAAYGVGTFAGNAVAPLLRRRYGEDRLTAGALVALAVVAAFGALGPSRPLVLLVSRRPRRRRLRRPPGVRRARPDPRPGRLARPVVRPLRDALPARLGGRRHRRRRRSPSPPASAWPSSPWPWSPPPGCTSGPCARPTTPTSTIPFDPVEVARRRIDHAIEWHRRRLDRLAVTELAGVVDLARAAGRRRSTRPTVARLDALRSTAVSTWPLDTRELDWAMRAAALAGFVEHGVRTARRRAPLRSAVELGGGAGPARPVGGAGGQPSGRRRAASTDDDVTVHCDEPRLDRQHAASTSRRRTGRPRRRRRPDRRRRPAPRRRRPARRRRAPARPPRPRASDLGPLVGEPHVDVVVELARATSACTSAAISLLAARRRRTRRAGCRDRPAAADRRRPRGSPRRRPAPSRDSVRRRPSRRSPRPPRRPRQRRPPGPRPHRGEASGRPRSARCRLRRRRRRRRRGRRRCSGAGAQGDDLLDGAVRPAVGQVGRQVGQVDDRLAPLAEVDQAELLARRLDDAVVASAGGRPRAAGRR